MTGHYVTATGVDRLLRDMLLSRTVNISVLNSCILKYNTYMYYLPCSNEQETLNI
jgi:hypothetical protein